ncbi:MAG: hypothetical protein ACLGI9_21795, partial [Thermoanaerobaculia bacterium]
MSRFEPPLIDRRTYGDLVAEVEELIQRYTPGVIAPQADLLVGAILDQEIQDPQGGETILEGTRVDRGLAQRIENIEGLGPVKVQGWQPVPGQPDFGGALARIFGRMAELAVTRLNRLPERNFLAFLDLIGTRLNPPQPARVPLTFQLSAGSPVDALVPAGTQAAALPLEGESEPALFETERDLIVTRSQLAAVYTREPGRDLWADHTAASAAGATFWPFRGDRRIEHRLHVSELTLFAMPEAKTLDLLITPADAAQPWLSAVTWSWWNGLGYQAVTPTITFLAGPPPTWRVRFTNVPGIAPSAVDGIAAPWLHGRLETGLQWGERGEIVQAGPDKELRRRGARPAAALVQTSGVFAPVDLDMPFFPFGEEPPASVFYLSTGTEFTKPKSWIEIETALDAAHPPNSTGDLAVTWEYWGGSGTWKTLTVAAATPAAAGRFLAGGTLRFQKPDDWLPGQVNGVSGFWLRARVSAGSFGVHPNYRPPRLERVTLGDDWRLPRVDSLRVAASIDRRVAALQQVPERGFANQSPLDLSKDFYPFGDKPKAGDAFYLASEEAFSKPLAQVELNVALTDPATAPVPDTTNAMLTWEY